MKKLSIIKKVYGSYFIEWRDEINEEDGALTTLFTLPKKMIEDLDLFRLSKTTYLPKKLLGLKENNGWLKVDLSANEVGFPNLDTEGMFWAGKLKQGEFKALSYPLTFTQLFSFTSNGLITHYKPIPKQLNPFY